MQIKKILNKKDIEDIENIIYQNYGCNAGLCRQTVFITSEGKVWITSKETHYSLFDTIKRCYRIGIYFGKLKRNNKIKLSIEGALMIGRYATKNVAVIKDKEAIQYMQGYDVKPDMLINADINNFILIKHKKDILGIGILREGYIESIVPKSRRLTKVRKNFK